MTIGTSGIFILAVVQWRRSAGREAKRLYGGLASYILGYGIPATIVSWIQISHETPTGTWIDLAWTTPLLYGAFWAATWQRGPESEAPTKRRNYPPSPILF